MEVFRLISYSASHICLISYVLVFTKWRYSVKKTMSVAAIAAVLLIALEFVRYYDLGRGERRLWSIFVQILIVQVISVYLSEYRDFRGLFTGLTSSNYVLFGNIISRLIRGLGCEMFASIGIGVIINLLFLWWLIRNLRPAYLEVQRINGKDWSNLCLIPSAFYVSLLLLMNCIVGTDLAQNTATLSVLMTMYINYVFIFRMIQNIYLDKQIEKEREVLNTSIKAVHRIMEEVRIVERQIGIINHDRRHMARTMRTLIEKQEYEALKDLLTQEEEPLEYPIGSHYCDSAPLNGVVCYYVEMARRSQIQIDVSIEILEPITFNEWEMAVVIGNLMENAIHAAVKVENKERRAIWLCVKPVREKLMAEIQNGFQGERVFDRKTGLPVSKRKEGHGFGLPSVIRFVERNQGIFDCGVEDGWFFVRLLL